MTKKKLVSPEWYGPRPAPKAAIWLPRSPLKPSQGKTRRLKSNTLHLSFWRLLNALLRTRRVRNPVSQPQGLRARIRRNAHRRRNRSPRFGVLVGARRG